MTLKIYLIGSIPKGDDVKNTWKDWKIKYKEELLKLGDVKFANAEDWKDETRPLLTVGHDSNLVKTSNIIIANAETKLGAGTSQEMVIAKYFSKPVITVLPKDTHHRRSNIVFNGTLIEDWIHPFIFTMSDLVVEKISDAIEWIKEYIENSDSKRIKDISVIDEAILEFNDTITSE